MQVFLIVHHAPLVHQLADVICNGSTVASTTDQHTAHVQVNCYLCYR